MAKRQSLAFDHEQLTQDLKQSTGQGVGAFFSSKSNVSQDKNRPDIYQVTKKIDETPLPEFPLEKGLDTMPPHHHDTTVAWTHETMIETVRKAVKHFGKEAATYRFTLEEKQRLAEIIFTYRNRQIKTSENEIARIAINFLLLDYRENGETSILHQVLEALRI